jgi:hypothetical protein
MADVLDDGADVSLPPVIIRHKPRRPEPRAIDVNPSSDPRVIRIVKPPRARKTTGPSSALLAQVDQCRNRAIQWDSASKGAESTLFEVLELAATIHERCEQSPDLRDALRKRMAENGIKVTRATKNACLPLIKCVFVGLNEPRSNLSRYASVVRGYCQSGVEGFQQFIEQQGGLVEAAKKDRREHSAPRPAAAPIDEEKWLSELIETSRPFSSSVVSEIANGRNVVVVLLGREGDGWRLLFGGAASGTDLRYLEKVHGKAFLIR